MERAPLRPVPSRPPGPVDPDTAAGHVAQQLPGLDEPAVTALALVELAGRSRAEVTDTLRLAPADVAAALARGRKALRRSLYPLPGTGWCERAERMISDRLDGELSPPGPARLDAHLANCARCVEHELRLAQAVDALALGFVEAHPSPAPVPPVPKDAPIPELKVVLQPLTGPMPPALPAPSDEPPGVAEVVEPLLGVRPAALQPEPEPQPGRTEEAGPAAVPAKVAERPSALPEPAAGATTLAWRVLLVLAIVLAVASAVIAVVGLLGASL